MLHSIIPETKKRDSGAVVRQAALHVMERRQRHRVVVQLLLELLAMHPAAEVERSPLAAACASSGDPVELAGRDQLGDQLEAFRPAAVANLTQQQPLGQPGIAPAPEPRFDGVADVARLGVAPAARVAVDVREPDQPASLW